MYIMKIYKYIGVALMVLSLGACKTDDLERDIDALKDRVTAMEAKVDRLHEHDTCGFGWEQNHPELYRE